MRIPNLTCEPIAYYFNEEINLHNYSNEHIYEIRAFANYSNYIHSRIAAFKNGTRVCSALSVAEILH